MYRKLVEINAYWEFCGDFLKGVIKHLYKLVYRAQEIKRLWGKPREKPRYVLSHLQLTASRNELIMFVLCITFHTRVVVNLKTITLVVNLAH